MKIGIDMGHSLSGFGTGASGKVKEVDYNRRLGNRLIEMLRAKGHTVVNCTVDSASSSNNQLSGIVQKANAQHIDLFVSIHLNAFNGQAYGTETYTYSTSSAKEKARIINDKVAASCGFTNRGLKTADYYVLRNTVAPACLVEVCFCDNQGDVDKWNTEKIAMAMFEGITGEKFECNDPDQDEKIFFRVIAGSYSNRENAENMVKKLKGLGIDAFIDIYKK
ncbi:MAG: N-acetylmuramoyl-L-alanine amidase [Clostridium sp.]|uniref:N-acetylmuramoyl-L-alanine amidase n=1 Tax=Clostridium sp. TaxID=1506 RepID=UPI003032F001